ncbi:universal stress protein [Fulvivirga sedimenti]|uniref:Universal stress protein n=1 Tax=Fulvivirga sedimenti TaxID=2879465 RepID=A0A9X1KX29_9BACT|nr:universal stress protein [Fulvivirga sedimenti]MCA6074539.1 universal stress protein [Fulvivirga sedimenti]MCA6075716.1 universal stress protein [Fulvivirga sedimenti]MCA6076844.1 universal stress protein [Fulvivirga sedimenti]
MKILVPVDFSPSSKRAVTLAEQLADALDGKVMLMHILEPVGGDVAFVADYDQMITDAQKSLDGIRSSIREKRMGSVETVVEVGFPTERILHRIEKDGISLVVMGMENDMSWLDRDVFGSNAYDIIKKGKCAVLTVPVDCKVSSLNKIMLAVELREKENIYLLSFLKRIVREFNSELYIVHVSSSEHVDLTFATSDSILWLKGQLEDVPHHFINLKAENVPDALNLYAEDHDMGLMVLSPEKHSFIQRLFEGSTTRKTVLHARVPILTFPIDY